MVYGLWSRIPQRNTDNGYIHQCESLWKWIDVIDDHPPIKAIHPCFDHGIPWHLYIMEYLDWMFELNHKDFTYIQPSNQSYSTQILSCFFQRLWSHGKVSFRVAAYRYRCKPLDQAWRTVKFMDGFHEDFQGIQQFGLHVAPEVTVTGRLSDWGFSKNSYRGIHSRVRLEDRTVRRCQNDWDGDSQNALGNFDTPG